ncbi:hypothetical protein F0U59_50590 [Archangium gephyra]|nr:hypothetical protein F0U59_50590 [Archangium gephyra]
MQVQGLGNVKAVAFGDYHSLVVREDGTAWGWGHNADGQLGDGTITSRLTPMQVGELSDVKEVFIGGVFGDVPKSGSVRVLWYVPAQRALKGRATGGGRDDGSQSGEGGW